MARFNTVALSKVKAPMLFAALMDSFLWRHGEEVDHQISSRLLLLDYDSLQFHNMLLKGSLLFKHVPTSVCVPLLPEFNFSSQLKSQHVAEAKML